MNIITARAPDPDIPLSQQWRELSPPDLFQQLAKQKFMSPQQMDDLREKAPEEFRCNTTIDFMSSRLGFAHLEQLFAMSEKPAMLPQHAHVAVLAENRRAAKIAKESDGVNASATGILEEAENAA